MYNLEQKICETLKVLSDVTDGQFYEFIDARKVLEWIVRDPQFVYGLESLLFTVLEDKLSGKQKVY